MFSMRIRAESQKGGFIMDDLVDRVTSRKFLLVLTFCVYTALTAVSGGTTWADALDQVKVAVLAYIGAEGAADVVTRVKRR